MKFIEEIRKIPLFRIVIPIMVGIILQFNLPIHFNYNLLILLVSLLTAYFIASGFMKWDRYRSLIFGLCIHIALLFAGLELAKIRYHAENEIELSREGVYIGMVAKEPKITEKSVMAELNLQYIKTNNQLIAADEKIVAYLPHDTASLLLHPGQKIVFKADLNEIQNLGNPDEFDYKAYLALHSIYNQAFIKENNWKIYTEHASADIAIQAQQLRSRLVQKFQQYGIHDQQLAVLSALSLGYKNKLDEKVKHAYSVSGGMHVLAVSGLHVGIIYVILGFLFKGLKKNKTGRFLQVSLILLFLWFYAFLTGLSPSVSRATIMFSIISIGTLFKRNINIYNSIAASALILLVINPYIIFEIGFQLSYLAVISIIFFQPKIYHLITIKNKFLDKVWILTTVSLAAQIGTAPISLYYFHQFPTYFLLTNFIVIPYASLLIYGAVLFLALSFIEPLALLLGKMLNLLVYSLNYSIHWIEKLPGSLLQNIEFGGAELFLMYVFIILISSFFIIRQSKYMLYSLICIALFIGVKDYKIFMKMNSNRFIVYNIPGHSFAQITRNNSSVNILYSEEHKENKLINNYMALHQNSPVIFLHRNNHKEQLIIPGQNLHVLENKRMVFIDDHRFMNLLNNGNRFKADYLVLMKDSPISVAQLSRLFDFEILIFDASNSYHKRSRWSHECKELNLAYHDVKSDGAFIAEL